MSEIRSCANCEQNRGNGECIEGSLLLPFCDLWIGDIEKVMDELAEIKAQRDELVKALQAGQAWQNHQASCGDCGSPWAHLWRCEEGKRLQQIAEELQETALTRVKRENE